ncbi:hypothetical protein [Virgibacillus pantothenticus]|uniref:Uncharacterized protein n=1 Tax=Virgibacillus pantothenticus TaxID=1473 RepID=A0A0L0QKC6_VIRPA|nr:hypothetical protein [Virgibacillus pantothenticus]KNE19075.1 hypothetical protein AFK71_10985 [Virgibacillus pantothenticus]MED3737241.1 hypothetical protein [Virgibacillus pantothenticus]QTY15525.1 hypothetical protein KBP50_16785 [Virgibacillus pantothenticus]SIT00383.1 hypothetical protein SAMN05421787_109174 [Virgibacillus pantothenticus]
MNETELKYLVELPNDGTHDQGVSLNFNKKIDVVHNIVVNPEDKRFFQRIKVYSNGFVYAEEVWRDYRILRFSEPFRRDGDTLYFDF